MHSCLPPAKHPFVLWGLHAAVTSLAVLSLAAGGFALWSDLRFLGLAVLPFEFLWTLSVLTAALAAGPRLGRRHWLPGLSRRWGYRALWPTYLLVVFLVANLTQYLSLLRHDLADPMIPLPLLPALLLMAWVIMTRRQLRRTSTDTTPHHGIATRAGAGLICSAYIALLAGTFLMCSYAAPLPAGQNADIAVVLGTGLRSDGSASEDLADRTRVAINLYKQQRVRQIVLSGAVWDPSIAGGHDRSEVAAMRAVCLAAGIPDDALVIDPVGVNARATAWNTLQWMAAHDYHSVIVCTSNCHLFRSTRSFAEYAAPGISLYAMPAIPTHWPCPGVRSLIRDLLGNVIYTFNPHYREPKAMTMQLHSPRVVVKKREAVLQLFDGAALIKTYTCISGGNSGDKSIEGDRKTPEGTFHIVYKNPLSKFHLSLGLDYPNREDAARGLNEGLITQQQHDDILAALASDLSRDENQKKLWYTRLGGEIFIHGHGEGRTGTAGCVALSNPDVEELYAILPLGTQVTIVP